MVLSQDPSLRTAEIGIIVGVCIGAVLAAVIFSFIIFRWRSKSQYQKLKKRTSDLSNMRFLRKGKNSVSSLSSDVDDAQRDAIIQKSLASRTTTSLGSWASRTDSFPEPYNSAASDSDSYTSETRVSTDEEEACMGIREDWKEYEASLHRDRSLSIDRHPAMNYGSTSRPAMNHPAMNHPAMNHPALDYPPWSPPAMSHPAVTRLAIQPPTKTHTRKQSINSPSISSPISYLLGRPSSGCHLGFFTFETRRDSLYQMPEASSFGAALLPATSNKLFR